MTFSNTRMREIERHNAILLKKILDKKKVSPPKTTVSIWQNAIVF